MMRILKNLVVCTASDLSNLPVPPVCDLTIILGAQLLKVAIIALFACS